MITIPANTSKFPLHNEGQGCRECDRIRRQLNTTSAPLLEEFQMMRQLLKTQFPQLVGQPADARIITEVVNTFSKAKIVYWTKDIWNLAVKGAEVFNNVTMEYTDVMTTPQWWVWDKVVWGLDDGFAKVHRMETPYIYSMLFIPGPGGSNSKLTDMDITAVARGNRYHTGVDSMSLGRIGRISIGEVIDDDIYAKILAAIRFMKMPIVKQNKLLHDKKERRAFKRSNLVIPEVETILLRRIKTDKAQTTRQSDVEWSCQWLVGGHWRNQWYPSKQAHAPVYINPYIKGPEDRDFKFPATVVAKVIR